MDSRDGLIKYFTTAGIAVRDHLPLIRIWRAEIFVRVPISPE